MLKEVALAFLTTGSAGRECPQSGNVNDRSGRKATIGKRSLTTKSGPSHRHKIRIGVKGIRKLSQSLLPLDNSGDAVMRAGMIPPQFGLALDICIGEMT